ncbi:dihydrodipicolinate synthetase [Auriscalpium vulgare]|uniref:Dihydrodipicolinate synthetase n=1 Tax=Auriscalpium vulgare TaxID=40419 RepID=A0ACB8RPX6_9AGAM|nr:dihydrodipicolinate synthetase [Auriscalpium vulgare]
MAVNGTNGVHAHTARPLRAGIYAPIPTFFVPDTEDLDLESFDAHILRLAQAGVWPLIAGSMGEALHLSHSERQTLIQSARRALDGAGLTRVPIIAGTGAGSTRETVELSKEAAAAGADSVIVITSGYFAGVLATHRPALKAFFTEVAEKSPVPVLIYNYPGASGGIDLDSDLITELAADSPNICGVKLTCGNVGKLTRIADAIAAPDFYDLHPRKNPAAPFLVLGGFADFIHASNFVHAHGAITGLGNVAPYTLAKLYEVSVASVADASLRPEALRLQGIVARADYTIAKASISGTKYLLEKLYGYGGAPRKPLPPADPAASEALWAHPHVQELVQLERELSGKIPQ